jgi:DNA-directed RNA polymerase subunit M/transcription elongation factor TFIIS
MIDRIIGSMQCEICGGGIVLDEDATISDYSIMLADSHSNIYEKIEDIVGKYLVYSCSICGATFKYTYKDLERSFRKDITEKTLMLVVKGQIESNFNVKDKFLVYCGKCNGLDGFGSCTKTIFNKCEIKRFPLNEL